MFACIEFNISVGCVFSYHLARLMFLRGVVLLKGGKFVTSFSIFYDENTMHADGA